VLHPGTETASPVDLRLSTEQARSHIDELDLAIVNLLHIRRDVSRHIQQARLRVGGGRIDPGREATITQVYRSSLGEHGVDVAAAVLRVCRS
jgi:chorismate mutase